jgi:hypothetical protein
MAEKFLKGGYGYGDAKKELFSMLWEYFLPLPVETGDALRQS